VAGALNDGPVGKQFWRLGALMSVGVIGVLAAGLADAFFLARAGETQLASVGFV
jgi:NADPH-dependent glutamate synthase beta subunit-like oxidoreductase